MKRKLRFAVTNQVVDNVLRIDFLDDIYPYSFDEKEWTINNVVEDLIARIRAAAPTTIIGTINSGGGDLSTALAIHNFLKSLHPTCKVVMKVLSIAASAAVAIGMAASPGEFYMARNSMMMVHEAESWAEGRAQDLINQATAVEKYNSLTVDIYAERTGTPAATIRALLAKGDHWMTAQEALAQGYCDALEDDAAGITNYIGKLDDTYANLPAALRTPAPVLNQATTTTPPTSNTPVVEETPTTPTAPAMTFKERMQNLVTNLKTKKVDNKAPNLAEEMAVAMTETLTEFAEGIDEEVESRVTAATESITASVTTAVTNAFETRVAALENENKQLVQALADKDGNESGSGRQEPAGPAPIGFGVKTTAN